jgi:hypothetical protein
MRMNMWKNIFYAIARRLQFRNLVCLLGGSLVTVISSDGTTITYYYIHAP